MKKLILFLLLALTVQAQAQMTAAERAKLVNQYRKTNQELAKTVAKLSEEQLHWRPDGGKRWSVADVIEHMVLAERGLMGYFNTAMAVSGPAPDSLLAQTRGKDEAVMAGVVDRSRKAESPAAAQPRNNFPDLKATMAAFNARRDSTMGAIQTSTVPVRERVMKSPVGMMDGYQWLLFMDGHVQRHLAQIKEVLADPNFPAGKGQKKVKTKGKKG